MKAVMLSIQPRWCELIASGKKTIEVRKTAPKLQTPFKCYIYCTNTRPYLVWGDVFRGNWETEFTHLVGYGRKDAERIWDVFNGRVMGEFVCDKIEKYDYFIDKPISKLKKGEYRHYLTCNELEHTCLSAKELEEYLGEKDGYGWHISDLKIYDEPKVLCEFFTACHKLDNDKCGDCPHLRVELCPYPCDDDIDVWCDVDNRKPLTLPPQSWCYVEVLGE